MIFARRSTSEETADSMERRASSSDGGGEWSAGTSLTGDSMVEIPSPSPSPSMAVKREGGRRERVKEKKSKNPPARFFFLLLFSLTAMVVHFVS